MWTFTANELLPGVADEILSAKSDTIWQSSESLYVSTKSAEPYIFISSFCENAKHKTSSSKVNRISSPITTISKSPTKNNNGRKSIHSATSSPNISLRSNKNASKSPTRSSKLGRKSNFDLNINLPEDNSIRSKSETNLVEKLSVPKNKLNNENVPNPLLEIQPIEMYDEKLSEKWFLKCVCGVKTGEGNLICCDKCGYWQHCICFNYNAHTSPENYVCVFCQQKRIRCKCGNNLDYNFSIIQCSNCGFYVHRRCEGLNYGPMPTEGDFLCHFCGKNKFKYKFVNLTSKSISSTLHSITDNIYFFDSSRINQINPSIINFNGSPFKKLLNDKFSDKEINVKTFFETVYNKYRTFFFICHPLYNSTTSKKKRNRLLKSFLLSLEYLAYTFYGIMHDKCVELIDSLIFEDLYTKFEPKKNIVKQEELFDLSENARLEIPNLLGNTNSILILSSIPKNPPIRQTKASGLMAMCDLYPDQFVLLVDGLLGDIEEFPYDPKVNSAYYQIAGTRFVLDTTRVPNSPLHLMKRSIYGNCALKLISVDNSIKCGLFISKSHITMNSNHSVSQTSAANDPNANNDGPLENLNESTFSVRSDKNNFGGVKTGTILTLGIDFLPAVLDEKKVSKFLSWHCSNELEDELSDIQNGVTNDDAGERERDKHNERDKDKDIYYYYNTKSRRSNEREKEAAPKHSFGSKGKKNGKTSYSSSNSNTNLNNYTNSTLTSSSSMDNSNKKKRGRKMKRRNMTLFTEMSLFSLFENEEAGEIMFSITDNNNDDDGDNLISDSDDTQDVKTDENELENNGTENSTNDNVFAKIRSTNSVESMSRILNGTSTE